MRSIILKDWEVKNLLTGRMTQFRVPAKLNDAGRVVLGRKNWHVADVDAIKACPWRVNEKLPVKGAWVINGQLACRVEVRIVSVRLDYVRAISESDAINCGARRFDDIPDLSIWGKGPRWSMQNPKNTDFCLPFASHAYANAWEAKHGEGSWKEPTFAWVTDFNLCPELRKVIPAIIDPRPGLNLCGVDEAGLRKLEALRGKHVLIEELN